MSTQYPEHMVFPVPQDVHTPEAQAWSALHTTPQAPQLLRSVEVLMLQIDVPHDT
jgi:hypothetical protein